MDDKVTPARFAMARLRGVVIQFRSQTREDGWWATRCDHVANRQWSEWTQTDPGGEWWVRVTTKDVPDDVRRWFMHEAKREAWPDVLLTQGMVDECRPLWPNDGGA